MRHHCQWHSTCDISELKNDGASPVETQDFASHGEVCARRKHHDVLMMTAFVACETQEFASLL